MKWPFRFEKICESPLVYLDGAHNERAALKLKETIDEYLAGYSLILVIGVFADKEYEKVVSILAPCAKKVFAVETPENPRALPAGTLVACAKKYCGDVTECADLSEAARLSVSAAEDTVNKDKSAVVACGSLSYLSLFGSCVRDVADQ